MERKRKTTVAAGEHFELWEEEVGQRWEKGGNGGNRRACGVVAALAGVARRLSVLDGGEEDDASPALGRAGGGRF